jgi:hypothetical protein
MAATPEKEKPAKVPTAFVQDFVVRTTARTRLWPTYERLVMEFGPVRSRCRLFCS